jgi:hypothetical protein
MNNGALNTDFEYFENGAIYELTFEKDNKVLKLIGVYCDDKLHNFTFVVTEGKHINLSNQKDKIASFANSKVTPPYKTFISLQSFAALQDSLTSEYIGQGVKFSEDSNNGGYQFPPTKEELVWYMLNTTPFQITPILSIDIDDIPDEIIKIRNSCLSSNLDLSWFKTTFVTLDYPTPIPVKKPNAGATLRQKLAVLKHVMRAASVTKKSDEASVTRLENSATFQNLMKGIQQDVVKGNSSPNSSNASRTFSLRKKAMCMLSMLRGKDESGDECNSGNNANANSTNGVVTPPINATTPLRPSNANTPVRPSNGSVGGKAKKDSKDSKEYKIYNKRRYVVRQGKLGGKYIQVGDKKVYV